MFTGTYDVEKFTVTFIPMNQLQVGVCFTVKYVMGHMRSDCFMLFNCTSICGCTSKNKTIYGISGCTSLLPGTYNIVATDVDAKDEINKMAAYTKYGVIVPNIDNQSNTCSTPSTSFTVTPSPTRKSICCITVSIFNIYDFVFVAPKASSSVKAASFVVTIILVILGKFTRNNYHRASITAISNSYCFIVTAETIERSQKTGIILAMLYN